MTEPQELQLSERRSHDPAARGTAKIKASWEPSKHRAREAGWWPEEEGQEEFGRGHPQAFLFTLCYNYCRKENHHEVRFALKITLRASMKLLSFQ